MTASRKSPILNDPNCFFLPHGTSESGLEQERTSERQMDVEGQHRRTDDYSSQFSIHGLSRLWNGKTKAEV